MFGACWVRTQPPSLHAARFEATFLADSVLGDTNSVPRRQKICPRGQNFCPLEDRISPRGQNQSVRGTQRGDRNCALEGHEEEVVAEPQGEPPVEVQGPEADVAGFEGQAPQAAEAEVQAEAETGNGRSRPRRGSCPPINHQPQPPGGPPIAYSVESTGTTHITDVPKKLWSLTPPSLA